MPDQISLQAAGDSAREFMDKKAAPKSRVDEILRDLPADESNLLRNWLMDPDHWSAHMIAKALVSYSKEQATNFTCGHSTLDRWRILNGVKQ